MPLPQVGTVHSHTMRRSPILKLAANRVPTQTVATVLQITSVPPGVSRSDPDGDAFSVSLFLCFSVPPAVLVFVEGIDAALPGQDPPYGDRRDAPMGKDDHRQARRPE
jgi:hypothetical protein